MKLVLDCSLAFAWTIPDEKPNSARKAGVSVFQR